MSESNYEKINQRLDLIYLVLCCINYLIIAFVSIVMVITLNRIIDGNSARQFIDSIGALPITPPHRIILFSTLAYIVLLALLFLKKSKVLSKTSTVTLYILVITFSMLTMYFTGFSSNSILLLVIANFFIYSKSNESRTYYLVATVCIYFFCNYNFLSFIPMIPFQDYISAYNSETQTLLNVIMNLLNTSSIIIFIILMVMMVMKESNESKRVQQLNTELQALNIQLEEFALMQEKMGETKERNRLAREIHDTLGHTLTGLSMGIDACSIILDTDPSASKLQLQMLSKTARQGLTDVRRSVHKLRPDALERNTLRDALQKLINDFQALSDVKIKFAGHLEISTFEPDEEDVIYRVVQECLTNSVRHGHAKEIFVSFALEDNTLILIVEDNGVGCDMIEPGFGLHHMRERVELLQGHMRVYGGEGFVVIVEIPLRKENFYD